MISKAEHVFEEGQRINFQHLGATHEGVITTINRSGDLVVRTKSGHTVVVHPSNDSAEPHDWPQLKPEHLDAVRRALGNHELDEVDAHLARNAFEKITMMFFLDGTTDAERTLRRIAAKCAGTSVGAGNFAKRAGAQFRAGQRFRDRHLNRVCTIESVDEVHKCLNLKYADGTPGMILISAAQNYLEVL